MGKVLFAVCDGAGFVSPTGTYEPLTSSSYAIGGGNTVEARFRVTVRIPGTLSKLQVRADAVGTSRFIRVRKNGADATLVINPTDTTAGVYSDASNSDTFAAGDSFGLAFTSVGSDPTYSYISGIYSATSTHAALFSGSTTANLLTSATTYYMAPAGRQTAGVTTEANSELKVRLAGTLKNAQLFVINHISVNDATFRSRINGSDGNIIITVTASTTGLFEDTSNTDALVDGDDFCFAVTTGAGTITQFSIANTVCGIDYGSSVKQNDLFSRSIAAARTASGTSTYYALLGRQSVNSTTEADVTLRHGFSVQMSRLRLFLSANTYSASATVRLRKNAADGNQTITIGAGATGLFEDTTNTDNATSTDDICWSITGGTSGSISIESQGITEEDVSLVTASSVLASSSTLRLNALRFIFGTTALASSSTLRLNALRFIFGTTVLASSSTLRLNALRFIQGETDLAVSSTLRLNALRFIQGQTVLASSSTLRLNALRFIQGTALLASSSTIRLDAIRTVNENLIDWSEDFTQTSYWTLWDATLVSDATIAPDGTFTADKLVETDTTTYHFVGLDGTHPETPADNGVYTLSVYFKAAERTDAYFEAYTDAPTYTAATGAFVNLSAPSITSGSGFGGDTVVATGIEAAANGFYRVWITFRTPNASPQIEPFFYPAIAEVINYDGDGTSGVYIWGAQLNRGTIVPYIKNPSFTIWQSVVTLAASSTLSVDATVDTTTIWQGTSVLAASSTLRLNALRFIQGQTRLAASSALLLDADRFTFATTVLAGSSTLAVDATKLFPASSAVLAASSTLRLNALLYLVAVADLDGDVTLRALGTIIGFATTILAASSTLRLNALRFIQGSTVLASSSTLTVNAIRQTLAVAVLSSNSTLALNVLVSGFLKQSHFRFRSDVGPVDASPTWIAAEDVNI